MRLTTGGDESGVAPSATCAPGLARVVARLGWTIAAVASFVVAWLPLDWTIDRILYEDFFYYLRCAEHAAAGRGVALDGVALTNGFHPLWMVICVAAEAIASPAVAPHLVLSLAAALHLLQGALLGRLLRRLVGAGVAAFVALAWVLNYRVFACNLCGLETPLSLVALLLVLDFCVARPRPFTAVESAKFGLLLGFAALSRFDLLLFGAFLAAWRTLAPGFGATVGARIRGAAIAGAAWVAALVPWFAWSLRQSSTLLPNSQAAYAVFTTQRLRLDASVADNLAVLGEKFRAALWWSSDLLGLLGLLPTASPPRGAVVGALFVAGALVLGSFVWRRRAERAGSLWITLLLFSVVHYAYYATQIRAEVRYLMPMALTLAILGAAVGDALAGSARAPLRIVGRGIAALLFLSASCAGASAWSRHEGATRTHALHRDLVEMARWIDAHAEPSAVVGALNAGILSEFSGRTVVNLDGVINDQALAALREQRLDDYCEQRGVTWIVDVEGVAERHFDRFSRVAARSATFRPAHRVGKVVAQRVAW